MFLTWEVERLEQNGVATGRWFIGGKESRQLASVKQLAVLKQEIEALRVELGNVARRTSCLAGNEEAQRISRKLDQLIVRFLWASRASQMPYRSQKCSWP